MKTWLLRAGQLALTVLVTWFIAQRLGLDLAQLTELDAGAWRPDWIVFSASCIVLLTGMLLSGALWGRVVSDLSGVSLPVSEAIRIFLVANLARYVPGKLWQLAGLAVLASRRGVPATAATASAVVAHGASLTAASILGALVLMGGDTSGPAGLSWAPLVLLGITLVALLPPVFRGLLRLALRMGIAVPAEQLGPARVLGWLGLFLVQWAVYGWSFFCLARSFGLPGSALEVSSAYIAAYVLGYLALFAPAGLGVREVALTGLLTPAMGAPAAAGLSIIARVWSTAVEVIPAAVLWSGEINPKRR